MRCHSTISPNPFQAEHKPFISEALAQAPEDVRGHLQNLDFIHIDRTDSDYLEAGINKIVKRLNSLESPLTATGESSSAMKQGRSSTATIDNWWLSLDRETGYFYIKYHYCAGKSELDAVPVGTTSPITGAEGRVVTTMTGSEYTLLNLNPAVLQVLKEDGQVVFDSNYPLGANPSEGCVDTERWHLLDRARQIAESGNAHY